VIYPSTHPQTLHGPVGLPFGHRKPQWPAVLESEFGGHRSYTKIAGTSPVARGQDYPTPDGQGGDRVSGIALWRYKGVETDFVYRVDKRLSIVPTDVFHRLDLIPVHEQGRDHGRSFMSGERSADQTFPTWGVDAGMNG